VYFPDNKEIRRRRAEGGSLNLFPKNEMLTGGLGDSRFLPDKRNDWFNFALEYPIRGGTLNERIAES
jgi:hypothetical protein